MILNSSTLDSVQAGSRWFMHGVRGSQVKRLFYPSDQYSLRFHCFSSHVYSFRLWLFGWWFAWRWTQESRIFFCKIIEYRSTKSLFCLTKQFLMSIFSFFLEFRVSSTWKKSKLMSNSLKISSELKTRSSIKLLSTQSKLFLLLTFIIPAI